MRTKNIVKHLMLLVLVVGSLPQTVHAFATKYTTLKNWFDACRQHLPKKTDAKGYKTVLTAQEFSGALNAFDQLNANASSPLRNPAHWLANPPAANDEFFTATQQLPFKPYVQRLSVPQKAKVAFHGDLHGDIHSLLAYLVFLSDKGYLDPAGSFSIKDPNFYMVFLGDYTDRGIYGAEVIYTLLRLKLANPDKVFFVRGNHEDQSITVQYGFQNELSKFGNDQSELSRKVHRMYDFLPAALYLGNGNNFIQCCHGGMEIGYNPTPFLNAPSVVKYEWVNELNRATGLSKLDVQLRNNVLGSLPFGHTYFNNYSHNELRHRGYGEFGFMWSDFEVDPNSVFGHTDGRGGSYGKELTTKLLEQASTGGARLRGVFRAHQHSASSTDPMMKLILGSSTTCKCKEEDSGIGKLWAKDCAAQCDSRLWDGIVCTFLVSPDAGYNLDYGNKFYDYDAFGILHVDGTFENWRLKVHRNKEAAIYAKKWTLKTGADEETFAPSRSKYKLYSVIPSTDWEKAFKFGDPNQTFAIDELVAVPRKNKTWTVGKITSKTADGKFIVDLSDELEAEVAPQYIGKLKKSLPAAAPSTGKKKPRVKGTSKYAAPTAPSVVDQPQTAPPVVAPPVVNPAAVVTPPAVTPAQGVAPKTEDQKAEIKRIIDERTRGVRNDFGSFGDFGSFVNARQKYGI